ncbi:hypothetical protein QBC35DRAFT_12816 [Podospora australis]|uniref:Uncharacterized protein n=1 Tax=Podospora australis TaxID=1536484 RepID=A0AAN6X4W0_9PEZI|nr:hypothetical protein QBC35DRAFT_12816 [Podospora australis]
MKSSVQSDGRLPRFLEALRTAPHISTWRWHCDWGRSSTPQIGGGSGEPSPTSPSSFHLEDLISQQRIYGSLSYELRSSPAICAQIPKQPREQKGLYGQHPVSLQGSYARQKIATIAHGMQMTKDPSPVLSCKELSIAYSPAPLPPKQSMISAVGKPGSALPLFDPILALSIGAVQSGLHHIGAVPVDGRRRSCKECKSRCKTRLD